jgi:hypothetical protein
MRKRGDAVLSCLLTFVESRVAISESENFAKSAKFTHRRIAMASDGAFKTRGALVYSSG